MATLQQIENAINQVPVITEGLITNEMKSQIERKIEEINEKKEKSKFIKVPFVGTFDAGKSTLMNSLTRRNGILPTSILPETAIPCEMYYDVEERYELYENGEKLSEGLVEDFSNQQTHVGQIAKIYLNSEVLKEYMERGIVLVDMPGLGSGIEQHDTAIFNYIGNQAVFIYCVDILTGSLDKSSIYFLRELHRYGQSVAVIITKKNMSNSTIVEEVKESITVDMSQIGYDNTYIGFVGASNELEGLTEFLDSIDVDNVRANILKVPVCSLINNVIENLSIRKAVRITDIENAEEKIAELENRISEIKEDGIVDDTIGDTPEKSTEDVLKNVEIALKASADDIAQMIFNGSIIDDINNTIINIVRPEIVTSIKEESQQYMDAINSQVDKAIMDALISINMPDIVNDPKWEGIEELISKIDILVELLPEQWRETARKILESLPVIAAVFSRIINWLGVNKDAQIARVRQFYVDNSIPCIIENLRPNILSVITKNQETIKAKVTQDALAKLEQYKNELLAKIEEIDITREQNEMEVNKLSSAIKDLNLLMVIK